MSSNSSYSTCWEFTRSGFCPRGNTCKWEHPLLQPGGLRDQSQFCWNFQRTGNCPRGSQCKWIHELVLLPWPSPSIVHMASPFEHEGLAIPTTPEGHWDQFDENMRLFGTTSTFDPSMAAYTTPLALDSLTEDQIRRAEHLSKIPLPSEKLCSAVCSYCMHSFAIPSNLLNHLKNSILSILRDQDELPESECCENSKSLRSVLKRKSWITVQETLPPGLVSEIESLYERQVTSSTNLYMIANSLVSAASADRLLSEIAAIVASATLPKPADLFKK